jgi:hypothetical protein
MNPLEWKREHQVALVICAGIGFIFGFMVGLHEINPYNYDLGWSVGLYQTYWGWNGGMEHSINLYWLVIGAVGIFGAFIAALITYAFQLMRR